jgi:4-hydroxy-tetrahydrodipicolinate synthase
VELVTRLATLFPDVVVGVKDSSGNWLHTQRLIEERGALKILVGHEGLLERGMRIGASGGIAGSADVIPEIIKAIVHDSSEQPNLPVFIDELLKYPVIPAVKGLLAHRLGSPAWLQVRAPLTALDGQLVSVLDKQLDSHSPV